MKLKTMKLENGGAIQYRPGTSDEQAIEEVIQKKSYRRVRDHFDVQPKESWLDLGANIGAFAVYCMQRGGTAVCYEPERTNFEILTRNVPKFRCVNAAVSASRAEKLTFKTSPTVTNHYRGTVVAAPDRYVHADNVENFFAGGLRTTRFDGVKMDIEGAEGAIIDHWYLPKCEKLVMEYHTSRDSSVVALERRLKILKKHFDFVKYPSDYDKAIASGVEHYRPRFDKLIFCWRAR